MPGIQVLSARITTRGGDGSLADGEHGWTYELTSTGPDKAWWIHDQGQG